MANQNLFTAKVLEVTNSSTEISNQVESKEIGRFPNMLNGSIIGVSKDCFDLHMVSILAEC